MIVTFISQCEKKSLNKTRRVLDTFANRIGDRTWQTPITAEGLQAVKKLLKKTATKNTAVACHRIKSRKLTKLEWIVGNRDKFNSHGHVPVNYTNQENILITEKLKWKTLEMIKYASSIAGLFHDFGKANILFQNKLQAKNTKIKCYEPYRHEWISLRLFQTFVGDKSDLEWLSALCEVEKDLQLLCFRDGLDEKNINNHPLKDLKPFAQLVAWLILTHHKLPLSPTWKSDKQQSAPLSQVDNWMINDFNPIWNSYNCNDEDIQKLINDNWTFHDLPTKSYKWRSHTSVIASKAKLRLKHFVNKSDINWLDEELFTTHISRLCLMLADHSYSAKDKLKEEWRGENYSVYANTYGKNHPKSKQLKQKLDEHLIGVAYNSKKIAQQLSQLNSSLPSLKNNKSGFTDKVNKDYKNTFGWQDDAIKLANEISKDTNDNGFFGINMASTGKGKTLGNAKIMNTLEKYTGRRRFNVAIGLRSLTLQTGKEFQKMLGLTDEELAIVVGGSSVKQLFEYQQNKNDQNIKDNNETGSESSKDYVDSELYISFKGQYQEHSLRKWTKRNNEDNNSNKIENLIQAPVLVCTIDHLISACEGTKGGKQIAPMLRLLTSDLILDEPDDFGLEDLPALTRLVNWAAMLGSRVLLSTATMPPNLAYALFQAYKHGWSHYAKANVDNWNGEIICAWFDEFKNSCKHENVKEFDFFVKVHSKFVNSRTRHLLKANLHLKHGQIVNVKKTINQSTAECYANIIQKNILALHNNHHQSKNNKNISIGLVRMANINPLVAVSMELLKLEIDNSDTCIHYCVYHSRYSLAIRSYIEGKLDNILERKKAEQIWRKDGIKNILEKHKQNNHIFVVLASPVAEVGRDHDYDWAIAEPSSMRSIIQLSGRVLRHRKHNAPENANVMLLSKNYKTLDKPQEECCFQRPGFESKNHLQQSHDLNEILNPSQYQNINSIPRISMNDNIKPNENGKFDNFVDLEHEAIMTKLFSDKDGAKIWWKKHPHWCGEMQRQQPFRKSTQDYAIYMFLDGKNNNYQWKELNEDVYPKELGELTSIEIDDNVTIDIASDNHFWFDLDVNEIYIELLNDKFINANDLTEISKKFGEVRVTEFDKSTIHNYKYHKNLGLYKV